MLIVLGVILVAISLVFIVYFIKSPTNNENDIKNHKTIGFIGSIGLMVLGMLLIFKKIRK